MQPPTRPVARWLSWPPVPGPFLPQARLLAPEPGLPTARGARSGHGQQENGVFILASELGVQGIKLCRLFFPFFLLFLPTAQFMPVAVREQLPRAQAETERTCFLSWSRCGSCAEQGSVTLRQGRAAGSAGTRGVQPCRSAVLSAATAGSLVLQSHRSACPSSPKPVGRAFSEIAASQGSRRPRHGKILQLPQHERRNAPSPSWLRARGAVAKAKGRWLRLLRAAARALRGGDGPCRNPQPCGVDPRPQRAEGPARGAGAAGPGSAG